jgi:rod shape determining protein RodA
MLEFIKTKLNFKIILAFFLIYFLGFITIYSTTDNLYQNHLIYFLLGLIIFVFIQFIDAEVLVKNSIYLYLAVMLLLILIFLVGYTTLGASRWLRVGELSLQPSELAKISVILLITQILSNNFKIDKFLISKLPKISNLFSNRFVLSFIFFTPIASLVLIQPDLGTTISIFFIFIALIFISSLEKKYFLFAFILLGIFSSPLWNSLQDYQKERVLIFLNPQADPFGSGYNTIQAEIAVGSGGFLGKGYSKGTQTQLNFLPIFWTDFLVATYAEEWGFVGLFFLISVYFYLIFQIYKSFQNTRPIINKFLTFGVLTYFSAQFLINFGMNLGLLPVTGIPIPLFSYGGTSLISSILLLAIVNKISLDKSS